MIIIGYQGETNAREHRFDISDYLEKWPDAVPDLVVTRPDGGEPYLATTEIDGNTLIWQINAYDTQIKGRGQAQLVFRKTVDGWFINLRRSR